MKKTLKSLLLITTCCSTSTLFAFDIGLKISTLGLGLEATLYNFGSVGLRANANMFNYKKNIKNNAISYDGRLKMKSFGLFADTHPFAGYFRATAGIMYNKNRLSISATPTTNANLFGHIYTPAQMGSIQGTLSFKKFSPYAGIGYDAPMGSCSISMELGVLFQGKSKANVSATGLAGANPQLLYDLKQDAEIRANKKLLRYYPVAGVSIRF